MLFHHLVVVSSPYILCFLSFGTHGLSQTLAIGYGAFSEDQQSAWRIFPIFSVYDVTNSNLSMGVDYGLAKLALAVNGF